MFYLATAVAVSFLLIPNKSSGASGASSPPVSFQSVDCERYLSGENGRLLVMQAEEWLQGLPAKRYMTPRRVEVKEGEDIDPEVLNPKVVWFTSKSGESYEDVRARFHEAREKSDQFYLQQVRAVQNGEREEKEAGLEPLSNLEKAALGIANTGTVQLSDVTIRIIPPRPRVLRLHVQVNGKKASDLALPLSSLRPGFRDSVALWLAGQLKPDEVPVILPSATAPENQEAAIRDFLNEHGQFGLFRKSNGRTFAYVFSMRNISNGPREMEGFTLDVYSVMPCRHREMMKSDLDFPIMRASQTYLCMSDTFLKLQVPFATAPDVRRPAGWTERQYQL